LALAEPVLAEWAVGGLQLAYDSAVDRIVMLAEEIGEEAGEEAGKEAGEETGERTVAAEEIGGEQFRPGQHPDDATERGVGRLSLTRTQAAAIARRGWDLVNAGRPSCALCGHPIDPEGHSCPRTNGHRPPAP
jgi:uncharacterized repeat protein (TIGR03847 family)